MNIVSCSIPAYISKGKKKDWTSFTHNRNNRTFILGRAGGWNGGEKQKGGLMGSFCCVQNSLQYRKH